jgi:hypothetical protein
VANEPKASSTGPSPSSPEEQKLPVPLMPLAWLLLPFVLSVVYGIWTR